MLNKKVLPTIYKNSTCENYRVTNQAILLMWRDERRVTQIGNK